MRFGSKAEELRYEASVRIRGRVKEDAWAPGGVEIGVEAVKLIGPSHDYPIQPKEHGVDFLLQNRHLWLRRPRQQAILRVRDEVVQVIRPPFPRISYTEAVEVLQA